MKKITFLSVFIFILARLVAQNEFYAQFKDKDCYNTIYTSLINKQNQIIVAYNRDDCQSGLPFTSSEILQLDNNGQIIKKLKIFKDSKEIETVSDIHELKDGYFIFTRSVIPLLGEYYLKFYQVDKSFQTIASHKFLTESFVNIPYSKSFYDTLNQKVVFNYFDIEHNSYFGSINLNCKDFIEPKIDMFRIGFTATNAPNPKNYLLAYHSGEVIEVNSSFDSLQVFPTTDDNNIANLKPFGKHSYLLLAEQYQGFPKNINATISNDITCKKLDKNWKVLKNVTLGRKGGVKDTFDLVGQRSLDWKNSNKIYVGWNTFQDFDWGKTFYEQKCWTAVAQLDSNLVPKWVRYFEKENYMFQVGLVATSDNGVLVHGEENALDSTYRYAFVMKLNENGLLTKDEEVLEDNIFVTIGPNPFRSQVTFAIGTPIDISEKMEVDIFDVQGRFLQKEKLTAGLNKLNLDSYTSGTYLYTILYKGKNIKQGKLVKIE